jgi:electron transfer flavoprotein alpha subunit
VARDRTVLDGLVEDQVRAAVELLARRGALDRAPDDDVDTARVPAGSPSGGPAVAVAVEPDRPHATREMLGASAEIAASIGGHVVALTQDAPHESVLGSWGADVAVAVPAHLVEEDVARALASWATRARPWAILAPSTAWGREVAARAAARLGAGLTGDTVGLEVQDGRLVAWKPAFGGQLVAAITSSSPVQMATVRAGVLPSLTPRSRRARVEQLDAGASSRLEVIARTRDDDLDALAEAAVVVGVGTGVAPDEYPALQPLLTLLDAELGATRKVTDRGWLPRARQIGITGRAISPRLYVALGVSGKFNHMVGVRAADTVLSVNRARDALVHDSCDIGIVAEVREAVPLLVAEIEQIRATA